MNLRQRLFYIPFQDVFKKSKIFQQKYRILPRVTETLLDITCRVRQKPILFVVSDKSPNYLSCQTKVHITCRGRQKSVLLVVSDKSPHYLSCQTKVHTTCRVTCECFALKTPELLAWKPLPHVETYKKNI